MRTYRVLFSRPGGFMNWPGYTVQSNTKIHAVAIVMFRKWFGDEPNCSFGIDGFIGQAEDAKKNCVEVEQENYYHHYRPGATTMRRPLCPMIIKKEVA
jgi:hypothetical protein